MEKIKAILDDIKDPDLGLSLRELDAVSNVSEDGNDIVIELELPGPITYCKADYLRIFERVFDDALFSRIKLQVSEKASQFDASKTTMARNTFLKDVKRIIAVASGKGGVGKSTIAANIAAELALQGAKVGILDADIYGPSQTIMFGCENEVMEADTDQHGRTKAYPVERYGVKVASLGFVVNRDQSAALRGPMLSKVFSMFYEQIAWGELDFLVFDLPPGTGDIHLSFCQQLHPDGVVLVTTPQEISLADVRRGADLYRKLNIPILGVIENMSYFVPPDMPDKKYYIFGEDGGQKIAIELGLSVLGEVPFSIAMREDADSGKPIVLCEDGGTQKAVLQDIVAGIASEFRRMGSKTN